MSEVRFLDVSAGAQMPAADTNKPKSNPADALTSKETFLSLLVAQIKNQNPMQPQDGMQFVSQLAQFSGLEQTIEMRKELEAIHKILDVKPAATEAPESSQEADNS